MQLSTIAQGPLGLGGVIIRGATEIANFTPAENWRTFSGGPAWLTTAINDRLADEAVDRMAASAIDRLRARYRIRNAECVSALQISRAANAQGRLVALATALAALPQTNAFRISWDYGADDITRADLDAIVPGTLTNAQANALFTSAQAQ